MQVTNYDLITPNYVCVKLKYIRSNFTPRDCLLITFIAIKINMNTVDEVNNLWKNIPDDFKYFKLHDYKPKLKPNKSIELWTKFQSYHFYTKSFFHKTGFTN